jgi:hypothetical protein
MGNEQMQSVIRKLQETSIILAHIENTQSISPEFAPFHIQSETNRLRIEKNLAEIREKLNRLIDPQ